MKYLYTALAYLSEKVVLFETVCNCCIGHCIFKRQQVDTCIDICCNLPLGPGFIPPVWAGDVDVDLVFVCGWPRCREYHSVIAWRIHAVLYCFVSLDVIPLGPGFSPCLDAGEVDVWIRPFVVAEELACLMQGTPNASTYENEFWCSPVGGLDAGSTAVW